MRIPSLSMAVLAVVGTAFAAQPRKGLDARVIKTRFPTADLVLAVRSLAPQPGEDDAAGRIQAEIDDIATAGGGVLFLAAGTYPLRHPVLVREGVTLRGDWTPPDAGVKGTILAVFDRPGKTEGAATLALERGSGCRELSLWYPEQTPEKIVPYPWAIGTSAKNGGDNVTLIDITLVNPYRGVRIGPEWNELHTLRNVFMTPLDTGFATDSTTDIGRLNRVVMEPGIWENSKLPGSPVTAAARRTLRRHMAAKVLGFDIGRSDWEYIYGVRARGLATGLRFRAGRRGTANAVMLECEMLECTVGIRLDHLNGVGLSATACRFAGTTAALETASTFSTVAQFNTCSFSGAEGAVRQAGPGFLSFQHCRFEGSVQADSGKISLLDGDFSASGPHVRLGRDLFRARILGCRFTGTPDIDNQAPDFADVVIGFAPLNSARLHYAPPVPAPAWKPATAFLISVAATGASSDLADNAAAFTQALKRARDAGGGTVYVPAGLYRFRHGIVIPSGVELRGCFDVPHHTISAGSVLLPMFGRDEEKGTPFLQMETASALRGLTVWYPEQDMNAPRPYPWTVRALGPRCRVEDVTLGNAWQGVDFWTHPSDGHVIRYLAGACFRRGLAVSRCRGRGWVEDVQFNPHYSLRLPPALPRPPIDNATGAKVIDFQRHHLDGMVFGRCADEQIFATFLYAAYDGLAFRDDGGGTAGRVLIHGTDTASRSLMLEATAPAGIDFVNAQLVALGKWVEAAIVSTPNFAGKVRLFNSQIWAGPATAHWRGGSILLQQANTLSGPVTVEGGTFRLENVTFGRQLPACVEVSDSAAAALIACVHAEGVFRWKASPGSRVEALANSAAIPRIWGLDQKGMSNIDYGFEPGGPPVRESVLADTSHKRGVAEAHCRIVSRTDAPQGTHVLELAGRIADPAYAFCYFRIADGPFLILPDTVLRYRMKPLNAAGRHTGIDAALTTGAPLRDRGLRSTEGVFLHPSPSKGKVDVWQTYEFHLGHLAGNSIRYLMAAFDSRKLKSREFAVLFDEVSLHSAIKANGWKVEAVPPGGRVPKGTRVALESDHLPVRYTLDGSNPTPTSPRYETPLLLPPGACTEIRFAVETGKDTLSPIVYAELYETP